MSANDAWGGAAADTTTWGVPAEGAAESAEAGAEKADSRPPREPEEEDNTLTLDEYLKKQKEKELEIVPKLETRMANEGDSTIWKDAVVVNKKDEDDDAFYVGKVGDPLIVPASLYVLTVGYQTKNTPKTRAKKEEKVFLEIDARFERPQRGGGRGGRGGDRSDRGDRGDRGERRGGRGRGGRGRGADGSTGGGPLNVDDQTAFPSLS